MGRSTKTTGSGSTLRASIPMEVASEPSLAASWDIAEGLLDGLQAMSESPQAEGALQREATAAYSAAKGMDSDSDNTERAFGRALARALILVAAHRGLSASEWGGLGSQLGRGAMHSSGSSLLGSSPFLGGIDLGAGVGAGLGAASALALGAPPQIGAGIGAKVGDLAGDFAYDQLMNLLNNE